MTTLDRKRVARHEAGHAAAAIVGGKLPKRVTADWPSEGVFGEVEMGWKGELTPERAADVLICVLMGPLVEGREGWPPPWPPDRSAPGDEGQLAACCRYLRFDEEIYRDVTEGAHVLALAPDYLRLVELIARALELRGELDADDLRWLIGERTLRTYNIDPEKG